MEVTASAAIIAALLSTAAISILPNFLLFLFPDILTSGNKNARNILSLGEALAAGALLGDVFLHTIPHAIMENLDEMDHIGIYVLIGFVTFFVMDQLIRANQGHAHHHTALGIQDHNVKNSTSHQRCDGGGPTIDTHFSSNILLNLTGDSLHNFTDGLAIGTSFTAYALSAASTQLKQSPLISAVFHMIQHSGGLVSLSVMFHEIPHELGDFSVLLMNGMTKKQAILAQFTTAIAAFLGTGVGLLPLIFPRTGYDIFQHVMMPFTAGGFLYLAAVTILPDLMEYNNTLIVEKGLWMTLQFVFFISGILFMHFVATMEEHEHHVHNGHQSLAHYHHHHDHHEHHHEL